MPSGGQLQAAPGIVARFVNDADTTLASTESILIYSGITAPRVVTLPKASTVPAGTPKRIMDASGQVSGVRTITATAAGGDTLSGANTLNNPFDTHEYTSDGMNRWVQTLDTK